MTTAVPGAEVALVGDPAVVVLSVAGRTSPDRVSQDEDFLHGLVQRGHRRFVIDLSGVDDVSSEAIGVAIHYHVLLGRCGGSLVVVKAPAAVMARIGRFILPILRVADTRAEALSMLGVAGCNAVAGK